jgi:dipeptidase
MLDEDNCWFGKNSDREAAEPQRVEWHDPWTGDSNQKATYLQIDVPDKRHAAWLSRPDWMWGAEMGVNEHGVAIGNEAVYTRLISRCSSALLGMDLVRLGLEQGRSADDALEVITDYLQRYGQGGPAGFRDKNFRYDNSFLIADANGGWQLETAGQFWVAKKLNQNNPVIAISNDLSIGCDYTLCSDSLPDLARKSGYWNGRGDFNFRKAFATWFMPWAARSVKRRDCNLKALDNLDKRQPVAPQLAQILRQHKAGTKHSSNADVCMHEKGLLRPSQTTQSMICHLSGRGSKTWMTGGSAPCISLFKPLHGEQKNWLGQHPGFWDDWLHIYNKTEVDQNLKVKLQQHNRTVEEQLWEAGESQALALQDDWWRSVSQL